MTELEAIVKLNTILVRQCDPNDHEAIRAVELAVAALSRRIVEKPVSYDKGYNYKCPTCGATDMGDLFCHRCGQRVRSYD